MANQVQEPYTPQSRLLAQLLAQRHAPVQSIGQGIADVIGDLGKAYSQKTMMDKDEAKQEDKASKLAQIVAMTMNPQTSQSNIDVQGGNFKQAQPAFPNGAPPDSAAMMADVDRSLDPGAAPAAPLVQAQGAFPQGYTKPVSTQARALAGMQAMGRDVPSMAPEFSTQARSIAESLLPPPKKITYAAPGTQGMDELGNKVGTQVPFAPTRDPGAPMSPDRLAQEIALRKASQAPVKPLGAGETYKAAYGGDVEAGMQPEMVNGVPTGKQIPIAGGDKDPAVIEQKRVTGLATALPKTQAALDSAKAEFQKTRDVIAKLKANRSGLDDVTGFGGTSVGKWMTLAGGDASKAQADIDQLKGKAFLSGLSILKQASPTGATGLGAASEREGAAVTSSQAALDQHQGDEDFITRLDTYDKDLAQAQANLQKAFESEFAPVLPKSPEKMTDAELMEAIAKAKGPGR